MRNPDELAQIALLLCIIAIVMFSLAFPWSFRTRVSRKLVHLPLLLLILYPAYESTMPPRTNIRIDLIFIWPALGLVAVCYLVKLLLRSRASSFGDSCRAGGPELQPASQPPPEALPPDMDKADERLALLLPKPKNGQKP